MPKILSNILILFLLLTISCSSNKTGKKNQPETKKREFVLPQIPVILTAPEDRANYLVSHYWDNFDFNDTILTNMPEVTEQALRDYVDILPFAKKEISLASIKELLKKAEEEKTGRMYVYFLEVLKKYLHDPNSPVRNEEFYIPAAEYIIDDKKSDIAEKERAKYLLGMMMKNRVGETAIDFTYTLASGRTGSLHGIKAPYIMLFFYNPDCHACAEYINSIKTSPAIQNAINQRGMKILAFYPDKEIEIWKNHLSDIPPNWINGYDRGVIMDSLKVYHIKAIPTVYLLDENKKVILKDVTIPAIENYFMSM